MSKRVVSLILVGLMLFSLTGCGGKAEKIMDVLLEDESTTSVENKQEANNVVEDDKMNFETNDIQYTEDVGNAENVENVAEVGDTFLTDVYDESGNSPEDIALAFLRYIRNEEFDKVIPLMTDEKTLLLNGEDIYDVLLKDRYEWLEITDKDAIVETNVNYGDNGRAGVKVILRTTDTNYDTILFETNVRLSMNEDNLWRVNYLGDLAYQNFGIVVPKNCSLIYNGVEVNRDTDVTIRPYEKNIDLEIWEFNYMGCLEKELVVKSSVFENTITIQATKDNELIKPDLYVSDEITTQANEFVKNIFVELFNGACDNTLTVEQVKKYVSDNAVPGTAEAIFEAYKEESKCYGMNSYKDVQVTNIIPHLTTKNTWYTDDSMYIVFGMTITWQDPGVSMTGKPNYTTESMDKYFDAKLEYINGEFKIMDSDVELFDTIALLNSVSDDF